MNRSTERVYGMKSNKRYDDLKEEVKVTSPSADYFLRKYKLDTSQFEPLGKTTLYVLPEADPCKCENCGCKTTKKVAPRYKYNEDNLIAEISQYIDSTYSGHYVPGDSDIQALDVWDALGSMLTSCRDVALKYLWRIGRKGSYEDARKDIIKSIHYCILMLYSFDKQKEKEKTYD